MGSEPWLAFSRGCLSPFLCLTDGCSSLVLGTCSETVGGGSYNGPVCLAGCHCSWHGSWAGSVLAVWSRVCDGTIVELVALSTKWCDSAQGRATDVQQFLVTMGLPWGGPCLNSPHIEWCGALRMSPAYTVVWCVACPCATKIPLFWLHCCRLFLKILWGLWSFYESYGQQNEEKRKTCLITLQVLSVLSEATSVCWHILFYKNYNIIVATWYWYCFVVS